MRELATTAHVEDGAYAEQLTNYNEKDSVPVQRREPIGRSGLPMFSRRDDQNEGTRENRASSESAAAAKVWRTDAIIDLMLENPYEDASFFAAKVGVQKAWFSRLISSDMFRARYEERRSGISALIMASLSDQVADVASRALAKLGDAVDKSEDAAFILKAADSMLQRAGFGVSKGITVNTTANTQNNLQVSGADLAFAREQLGRTVGGIPLDILPNDLRPEPPAVIAPKAYEPPARREAEIDVPTKEVELYGLSFEIFDPSQVPADSWSAAFKDGGAAAGPCELSESEG